MPELPVLITVPHASGAVPFDILAEMLGEGVHDLELREARLRRLTHEGDPYTEALFYLPGAVHVQALASRFVVDVNRRRDEAGPNGVVKLTDFGSRPLYPAGFRLTDAALDSRLRRYWDPFHQAVEDALRHGGIDFFVDGHSMTPVGPSLGPDLGRPRPALTLITGGDTAGRPLRPDAHTSLTEKQSQEVLLRLEHHFAGILRESPAVPAEVRLNDPFAVGGIQQRYSDPARAFSRPGFALEFNRALFLQVDEDGVDRPLPGRIERLNRAFRGFVMDLLPLFARA